MDKIQVTLPDGRIVSGYITDQHKSIEGRPLLIVEGEPYSAIDAISKGLSIYPIDDPDIDRWLSTFTLTDL
jgi:hypothetical protein